VHRKYVPVFILLNALAGPVLAAPADVGVTVTVKNEVQLESGQNTKALLKGAVLHQNEVIVTGTDALAEVELLDKTKLAVGPDARLVLDKFVYDPGASQASIAINLSKGAFRFLTGLAPKESYEIKTPTASLGIRGTVLDIYVGASGETAVLLQHGAVQVCNLAGACQLQNKVGSIFFVDLQGVISAPSKCGSSFLNGIGSRTAFPFVGKKLIVDPVRRMSVADLECGPVHQPTIINAQAVTPPSTTTTGVTEATGLGPEEIVGITVAGGIVAGIVVAETQPASP
jgi:hypothetical protein